MTNNLLNKATEYVSVMDIFSIKWDDLIAPLLEDKGLNAPTIVRVFGEHGFALVSSKMKDGQPSNIVHMVDTVGNIIFTALESEVIEVIDETIQIIYDLEDHISGFVITSLLKDETKLVTTQGSFIKNVTVKL